MPTPSQVKLLSSENNSTNQAKPEIGQVNFKEENQQDEEPNQDKLSLSITKQASSAQKKTSTFHDGSTKHFILKSSPPLGPQIVKRVYESAY